MIRDAAHSDIPAIVDFAQALIEETRFVDPDTFSRTKTAELSASLIDHPDGILLVADGNLDITGFMAGAVNEHCFSYQRYAFEFGLFVSSRKRGGITAAALIKAFEIKAQELGATELRPGIMTGHNVDRIGKLYERLGYKQTGPQFVKRF